MTEDLIIPAFDATKQEKYELIIPQIKALVLGENDLIANLSNITAVLKDGMQFFWVGFYFVKGDQLVLGPFQGPVACTRINFGKGVCGTCWKEKKVIVVDDVEKFPGHIACSAISKSEIVFPAIRNGEVFLVMDVDSEHLSHFDAEDEYFLGEIIKIIEQL